MSDLATIDLLGYWLGIFLTFAILSFLYKDNPIYKAAEHLFIGVSIGYVVTKQYYDTLRPKLIENLFVHGKMWYLLALILTVMLLLKLVRRWAWLGRFPIAFVVAFYAGLQVNGVATGDLGKQLDRAMDPVTEYKVRVNHDQAETLATLPGVSMEVARVIEEVRPLDSLDQIAALPQLTPAQVTTFQSARGSVKGVDAQVTLTDSREVYWFGTLGQILLVLGLLCGLIYFYFSMPQKGAVGKIARVGVWILMIGFGASFGYTVQGRIALAIGRARDVMGSDKDPQLADQIQGSTVAFISIVLIVAGLVLWELYRRKSDGDAT